MATLKDKAQEILDEKNAKILPENIKEGVQVFDVTGTLKEGIDTSDATAIANDLAEGKTAYVNGELITGTLPNLKNQYTNYGTPETENIEKPSLAIEVPTYTDHIERFGDINYVEIQKDVLANAISLLPEKLVAGNTILGVEGTATSGIDTSDATATASDLAGGKTAYVNGEKVTGTLYESTFSAFNVGITAEPLSNENRTRVICEDLGKVNLPTIIPQNAGLALDIDNNVLAQVIELTPEKIVEGNTILGIEGTATSDVDAIAFAFPKLATYINNAVNFPDYLYLPEIKDVMSDESMVQFEYVDDLGATQFLSALPLGIPYAEIFKLFPYVFVSVREYYTTVPEAYNYAVSIWFDKNPFKVAISKTETVDSEGNPVTEVIYTPTLLASQMCIGTISYYCSFDEFVEIVPNNFVEQCSLGMVEKSMSSGLTSSTGTINGEHVALYGNVIIEDNTGENLFNFI